MDADYIRQQRICGRTHQYHFDGEGLQVLDGPERPNMGSAISADTVFTWDEIRREGE